MEENRLKKDFWVIFKNNIRQYFLKRMYYFM